MFGFFDYIIDYFDTMHKITNMVIDNVTTTLSIMTEGLTTVGVIGYTLPPILYASLMIVISISIVRLIIDLLPF